MNAGEPGGPAGQRARFATTVLAAFAAAALAVTASLLATNAHGEPSCSNVPGGAMLPGGSNREAECRQANETISGKKHEKKTRYWAQVAGAPHSTESVIEGSPTPYDADLFAVRFQSPHEGFAGGSACAGPATPAEADDCERAPVIYGIQNGREWAESYRSDSPGYVGGIAWINKRTALAVGGTGAYPRREPNPPGDEWDYDRRVAYDREQGAGEARAWLFSNGSWDEITDELPEGMRGLSALDVWIGREPDGSEWGLAGAYGQLWEWRGGRFTGNRLDKDSPTHGQGGDPQWSVVKGNTSGFSTSGNTGSPYTSDPALFHYRVREIRIAPDRTQKRAFAFTAGCCGPASAGGSRRIEYVPKPRKDETGVPVNEAPPRAERSRWVVSDQDYGDSVYSFALKPGRYSPVSGTREDAPPFGEPQPKQGSPTWSAGQTVMAPGGPQSGDPSEAPRYVASDGDTEPMQTPGQSGIVTGNGSPDWKVGVSRSADPSLDGLGLLSTTVTALRPEYGGLRPYCPTPPAPATGHTWIAISDELYVDAAGEDPQRYIDTLHICRSEQIQGDDTPTLDEEGPLRTREDGIQEGPSWGLNAIDMLDSGGAGFAVGDRGAILRIDSPPAAESDPPSVGGRRPAPLGDRSPYEPMRPPPAGEVGAVPPIATQPREKLPEPRLYRAGSPDAGEVERTAPDEDVHTIVMSRDGSEGWAIGPSSIGPSSSSGVITLYRYDGARWTRCDPVGTQFTEPDPACAELAPLYLHHKEGGARIRLTAAARVPLENDIYPSNDNELEIVAAGTALETVKAGFQQRPIPTVIRYRDWDDGEPPHWRLEDLAIRRALNPEVGGQNSASRIVPGQLAFTSPNEGWMVMGLDANRGLDANEIQIELWRFDGERWNDCSTRELGPRETNQRQATGPLVNRDACGDGANRLAELARGQRISLATAGERVYLAGVRRPPAGTTSGPVGAAGFSGVQTGSLHSTIGAGAPMILYRDTGAGGQWRADDGGYDPGFDDPDTAAWRPTSIAVAAREDGSYEGWAVGGRPGAAGGPPVEAGNALLRLDPSGAEWRPWLARDAASDYLTEPLLPGGGGRDNDGISPTQVNPPRQLTLPGSGDEPGRAFIAAPGSPHALTFNPDRERWEVLEKPGAARGFEAAQPMAFAPDGRGGAWAAYSDEGGATYFYDYTDTPPRDVFSEVANPIGAGAERPTALAGSPDGTLWLATNSGALYRYDRLTGWERARIPGWDPGRVVTRRSRVNAIAVASGGQGLAVGERGKVAEISASEVRLDAAAGTVCRGGAAAPCGTSFDLHAVAVAPDGSALAGGEGLALLWRPAGGELRKIAPPGASAAATITGVAMPSTDRAWLTLDSGQVFAGIGDGQGGWSWEVENEVEIAEQDRLLSEDADTQPIPLRAIAIDSAGNGYAVGDRGLVLERSGDGDEPWQRVDAGVSEELTSVALPAGEGSGALIGGNRGLVLTRSGEGWHIARAGDRLRPDNGFVTGLALLPGTQAGQVEAWAAVAPKRSGSGASQLLHYASDPGDPLLDAGETGARAAALPDVPAPVSGEISIAAFGRSDCHQPDDRIPCPPLEGTTDPHETVLRRVREEILARSAQPGGPQFAIYTGDGHDTAGPNAIEAVEQNSQLGARAAAAAGGAVYIRQWTGGFKFRRLNEALLDPIADRGLPLFGAIGARDLSETRQCAIDLVASGQIVCAENRDRARGGENLAWRQAMERKPAPWGDGEPAASDDVAFEPVGDSGLAARAEDMEVEDPRGGEASEVEGDDIVVEDPDGDGPASGIRQTPEARIEPLDPVQVPTGGASTHYAADILDPQGGEPVARLVVADTSLGSLSASDPVSQPVEGEGGQAAWLERVLCIEGSASDSGQCTRAPDQQAIVVSTAPTYSYGPTDPTANQADAAVFESILLRNRASVVVSGKLGWNGRYWATAPGVHEPCPGQGYAADSDAPAAGTRVCGQASGEGVPDPGEAGTLAESVSGVGGQGILPFVVASGAGGRFDELAKGGGQTSGEDAAADGFWHGYTIVRLDPSGDPRKTVVEQRPVLDWIGLQGATHVIGPRQRLLLDGLGREPIGANEAPRYDRIDSPAITHRYDLLKADPKKPWLSLTDSRAGAEADGPESCGDYVCLSEDVATIDPQEGRVKAGAGKHAGAYAIAMLSVGEQVATKPLYFKTSPSFRASPTVVPPPTPTSPTVTAPGTPTQPSTPQIPNVSFPQAPVPPALVPPPPAPPASPPQPPVPPPVPPSDAGPSPLSLSFAPTGLIVAPTTSVIPPPAPPINPAPPGGARKEARQRQAASQSSGADGAGEADAQNSRVDAADAPDSPPGSAMTRHEAPGPARQDYSFTRLEARDEGSPALVWGAGLTLAALALAAGFSILRPRSRRREPEIPAPAYRSAR